MQPHLAALIVLLVAATPNASPAIDADATTSPKAVASPCNLSCELLLHPDDTVIFDPQPEFGWECGEGEHAFRQSGYQIQVRAAGKTDAQPIWDTGRVESRRSINLEYGGPTLESKARYAWRVKTWDHAGDASEWSSEQVFAMARALTPLRTSAHRLKIQVQEPTRVDRVQPDVSLFDFGQDAFGYATVSFPPADRPREIVVRFGEKLKRQRIDRRPGGSIRFYEVAAIVPAAETELTVRPPRDVRNTSGDAVRLPESVGVVAPFRYLEVCGNAIDQQRTVAKRCVVQYPFNDDAASFESSDATLNKIWDLCKYSIKATTYCGIYVDGDRERIPYEADAYINQLSHYGVDREFALARRTHEYLLYHPTWPTEWTQHSVLMAWADYLHTGDAESLVQNYELLRTQKVLAAAENSAGLVDTSSGGYRDIVDWPEGERDGHEMKAINTVVNAFHFATLDRMSRIATAVGEDGDARDFATRAAAFKTAFNKAFWSEAAGAYVDGVGSEHSSLHSNLFPLAFGLVPAERRDAVVRFVKSRGMACSVYPAQFLLEGLYDCDEDGYALQLLTADDRRSWVNMLRSGSTITLEAWDIAYKPNLDWNHAWGAAPANIIPARLVGVQPAEPGYRKIQIQPRPGDLQWFKARVPTIRGAVDVAYDRRGATPELTVVVPGNATANIAMPRGQDHVSDSLLLDGRETDAVVRGGHVWIEGVPPGKHVVTLINSATRAQTVRLAVPK